jgi:hypothetical protein
MVGTSGRPRKRFGVVTASATQLAFLDEARDGRHGREQRIDLAAEQVGHHRAAALVGHVEQVDAREHLQQLAER